jgi:bifunctional DNA-binding transcriptional regulator/antitoxin component of YhaV-PrlF toxin-antitoxin module
MTLNYDRVWKTLNELESVTSKICSAREILDSAIDALENHKKDKAETLMYAVDEYLQYYLEEFDRKFKDAWAETVTKLKQEKADNFHSAMEALRYTDEEMEAMCDNAEKEDKVVKWRLPVEEVEDGDTGEQEYFITFPDDLLEAANLSPGDEVEWVEQEVGTFLLRKIWNDPYKDDMIAAGYKMVDGQWTLEKCEKQLNDDEAIAAGWKKDIDGTWIFRVH